VNWARMKAGVKRRWPLKRAILVLSEEYSGSVERNISLMREMLNVKEVVVKRSLEEAGVRTRARINYSTAGPRFKEKIGKIASLVAARPEEALRSIGKDGRYIVEADGEVFELALEDLVFEHEPPGNHVMTQGKPGYAILDIERTPELVAEGYMRDVARRIQAYRKELGLNPTDVLNSVTVYGVGEEGYERLKPLLEELAGLVRAKKVGVEKEPPADRSMLKEYDIEGEKIYVKIVK
ncbi:MAG: DUF5915 domain-containing protein, partial [Thermoproteota archaeon]